MKRVFIIVLDSLGIGEMPDAGQFGDAGSNTLAAIAKSSRFHVPTLGSLGLFNIDGVTCGQPAASPMAGYARLEEVSKGKDTTIGHWELAGVESLSPLPVYPEGFPAALIDTFTAQSGRGVLCNRPYSGTKVLEDYGEAHMATGDLIVYTSADSVWQMAAHEEIVPVEELYRYCEIARALLTGPHGVGRVIARPFVGSDRTTFKRTANRHDFSLKPPAPTVLDYLSQAGVPTVGVGKIGDIFAGQGIGQSFKTKSNRHGMETAAALAKELERGLVFVNLVDFDMLFGHRNDVDGYAGALSEFDAQLADFLPLLGENDLLMITADHGCDPSTSSTDHSREYVPLLLYDVLARPGKNFGTRRSFAHVGATAAGYFGVDTPFGDKNLIQKLPY